MDLGWLFSVHGAEMLGIYGTYWNWYTAFCKEIRLFVLVYDDVSGGVGGSGGNDDENSIYR